MAINGYTAFCAACWICLFSYWWVKSRTVKDNTYSQASASRMVYLFFVVLSFALVFAPFLSIGPLGYPLFPQTEISGLTGTVICLCGVSFAIWARAILGNNWSGKITLKKDHELIQTGPYRLARHPIYTGLIFAMLGTAITVGEVRGGISVIIMACGFAYKIKTEEPLLLKQFPSEYPAYKKKVKALIPYVF
jgi:protein-S-isoprenylcysteine O-methyltransferase Ste14